MSIYVPTGVDPATRAALGDIPQLQQVVFGNESSIPSGINAQRMGIESESSILQTVREGELFTLAVGEVANIIAIVTDTANGTTKEETVTVINTGEDVEAVAPDVYTPQDSQSSKVILRVTVPQESESANSAPPDDGSYGTEHEDPGTTGVVKDDGYYGEDEVTVPTHDAPEEYDPYAE